MDDLKNVSGIGENTGETKRCFHGGLKTFLFSLVHLAFFALWLYFSIYQPSWLSIIGLVVVGILAVHHYKGIVQFARACFSNPLFCGLPLSFSDYRIIQYKQKVSPHPTSRLIPDTIKINGDALSFRAKKSGKNLSSLLHFKIRKRKQQWQSQTHLLELTYKGVIEEPEGQRNF